MISGTKGTWHAVEITEPCLRRKEGLTTIIPYYILYRNPPDMISSHSARETGMYWEETACGKNLGLGQAFCIPVRQDIFGLH